MLSVPLLTVIQFQAAGEARNKRAAEFLANWWWAPLAVSVVFAATSLSLDILIPRKKIATIAGVLLGLMGGLLATVAVSLIIELVAESWDVATYYPAFIVPLKILFGIAFCYLGITTVLQTQDDFRLVIPYVEFAKQMRGVRPLLLDSSALIDARIVEIAETGISQAPIIIPRFVVEELQRLADAGERLKRARGRRGLEIVSKLQRSHLLDVSIDETPMPSKAVDHMLVDLARQLPAVIVTTDVGLRQVASIHGVMVLNLNDLANALKPDLIPGEVVQVELLRRGEQKTQAVGYLPDGTMVVAEDGIEAIGERVALTVTSSLQTSAGRMIFGRIDDPEPRQDDRRTPQPQPAPDPVPEPAPEPVCNPAPEPAAQGAPPEPQAPEPTPPPPHPTNPEPDPRRGPHPPRPPARTNRARNPRR